MKKILLALFMLFLFSKTNSQNIEFSDFDLEANLPRWIKGRISQINFHTYLTVDRTLNPFYLECDLNGDNNLDIALFVAQKETHKKGILIIHGNTFAYYLLGAGNKFGNGGDDYSWMKVWKLYRQSFALETTFTEKFDVLGEKKVPIKNIALQVAPSEGSSNLIVWQGTEYMWIHTGD